MNVEIHDFQSIAHAMLDVRGLTVIVGPSNRGKSALLRAIEGALFNRAGAEKDGDLSGFARVRPDGTQAANAVVRLVDVPTWDGALTTITWTKGKANKYDVDGDEYSRVGSEAPAVLQDMGFRDVWIGDRDRKAGERIRPQVGTQFEPLFLLLRPGSFVADVLGMMSRQAVVATAQGRCTSDLRATKQRVGVRQGDFRIMDDRLTLLTLPPETRAVKGLPEAADRTLSLAAYLDDRRRATVALQLPLPAPTGVQQAHEVVETITTLTQLRQAVTQRQRVQQAAAAVLPPEPAAGRYEAVHGQAKVVAGLRFLQRLQPVLRPLPPPADVPAIAQAGDTLAQLRTLVHHAWAAMDTLHQTGQAVRELRTEEEVLTGELAAALASLGVCPVCDRPTAEVAVPAGNPVTRKKRRTAPDE